MIGKFLLVASVFFLTSRLAIILILEHAGLFLASSYSPTLNEALDRAYSQYISSGLHNDVKQQFFQPPKQYSILDFTEFILVHRL